MAILNTAEFAWSLTIALAWIMGELSYRFLKLPRVSVYMLIGFLAANLQLPFLSQLDSSMLLLPANIAFGLILFEFGYHINLRWLKNNPWIGITGLIESALTFIAIYAFTQWYGFSTFLSLALAALCMAASPASILRVINEQRSSGQVTERIFHLSALNCVLAVITFNVIMTVWMNQSNPGNFLPASIDSARVFATSVALGVAVGFVVPLLLRCLGNVAQDATIGFALVVILLVALAHALKLSPTLVALTFGLTARHRRITLSYTKRNFGALGDLLTLVLFIFVASTFEWERVVTGATLGLILIAIRLVTKTFITALFAPISGITLKKGILTGIGLAPLSIFAVLTLAQSRYAGIALSAELSTLETVVAMLFILGIIGPMLTQAALFFSNEAHKN